MECRHNELLHLIIWLQKITLWYKLNTRYNSYINHNFKLDLFYIHSLYSDTSARLVEKDEDEVDDLPFTSSKLRQRAAPLLTDCDKKYAGKRTSRKKLDELEELGKRYTASTIQ